MIRGTAGNATAGGVRRRKPAPVFDEEKKVAARFLAAVAARVKPGREHVYPEAWAPDEPKCMRYMLQGHSLPALMACAARRPVEA